MRCLRRGTGSAEFLIETNIDLIPEVLDAVDMILPAGEETQAFFAAKSVIF